MAETKPTRSGHGEARPDVRTGARVALVVATALSIGLLVWAFTFPAYEGLQTRGGITTSSTRTLIEENGLGALVPVLVPLAVTVLTGLLLLQVREPLGRIGAWALVAVLAVFAVAAMFSIGMYVLPVVIALAVAVGWPRRTPVSR